MGLDDKCTLCVYRISDSRNPHVSRKEKRVLRERRYESVIVKANGMNHKLTDHDGFCNRYRR